MFISTNKSNPCPICTDIKGKCRQKFTSFSLPDGRIIDDQQIFCMAWGEDRNGYKFTGETSDRLWGQVNKSHPDPDEFKGDYRVISTEQFFNLGLQYCVFFPGCDGRNLVRQFLTLLKNTTHPTQLRKAIAHFESQYHKQFNVIKRICWQHLDLKQKQLIHSIYS